MVAKDDAGPARCICFDYVFVGGLFFKKWPLLFFHARLACLNNEYIMKQTMKTNRSRETVNKGNSMLSLFGSGNNNFITEMNLVISFGNKVIRTT